MNGLLSRVVGPVPTGAAPIAQAEKGAALLDQIATRRASLDTVTEQLEYHIRRLQDVL